MKFDLHHGDCLEVLRGMPDCSVDAVVTDPPYGLSQHTPEQVLGCLKAWLAGDVYVPKGRGFMGKSWDAWVPGPEIWRECLRVLKPGGYVLAFAGTRSMDLMSMAIRLAGFELRDSIGYAHDGGGAPLLAWTYGSGFPKNKDVSKAIDSEAGFERTDSMVGGHRGITFGDEQSDSYKAVKDAIGHGIGCGTASRGTPVTEAARQWQGWGNALKPAWEPIILARKPLIGTLAENVLEHGTGGLNIDASRIMTADQERGADAYRRLSFLGSASCIRAVSRARLHSSLLHIASALRSCSTGDTYRLRSAGDQDGSLLDHVLCEHLVARLFPNGVWCGGSSWSAPDSLCGCQSFCHSCDEHIRLLRDSAQCGAPSLADALERICSIQLAPEHSRESQCTDRLASLDDFLLAWSFAFLAGEYCTLYSTHPINARWPANLIHDGSDEVVGLFPTTTSGAMKSGTQRAAQDHPGSVCYGTFGGNATAKQIEASSGSAARFFYCAKADRSDRDEGLHGFEMRQAAGLPMRSAGGARGGEGLDGSKTDRTTERQNTHNTVKPTDLMRYLCRLVTQPGGVVLDPFMGSGSTGKAAVLEGFAFVGIEREAEYLAIARARIEHAQLLKTSGAEKLEPASKRDAHTVDLFTEATVFESKA